MAYSVDILTDSTDDPARPIGAYLLFVAWNSAGDPFIRGHVESDFLAYGESETEARRILERWLLSDVRAELHRLLDRPDAP